MIKYKRLKSKLNLYLGGGSGGGVSGYNPWDFTYGKTQCSPRERLVFTHNSLGYCTRSFANNYTIA